MAFTDAFGGEGVVEPQTDVHDILVGDAPGMPEPDGRVEVGRHRERLVRELRLLNAPFTFKGREDRFDRPMLFLFSEDDIQNWAAATSRIVVGLLEFILALHCERSLHLFGREEGAASHCQMGGLSYAHRVIFGWLNDVLCGKPLAPNDDPAAAAKVIELFGRYGGAEGSRRARAVLDVARLV